jgi:hypothetical protein
LNQYWRRFDSGFFLVLLLCLLAVWPFISRPSLPAETDAELHVFRLAELAYLVQAGEFYPRWAPNFYYGYGYPIFNYYAPLTYYLGLPVALLPWLDAVDGVKAVLILGLLTAALGMYGFVRDNWGRVAGLVAAAVYVYAPYIFYVDPHARGDLAEAFSFGVFPLALWALDRLRRSATALSWLAAVILTAAVILSHNLMAMVFFGLLLGWAVWRVVSGRGQGAGGKGQGAGGKGQGAGGGWLRVRTLLALLLGVGLSAFFWLPVALEQGAVNLSTLIGDGDHFDFRNHFLSWSLLLAPSPWIDWGASEAEFGFNLGIAQWLLGGLGLFMLLARRVQEARHLTFFALTLLLLLFLMLPLSTPVWEGVPLLPFMQFPWRLLGAAVAMLAVLAGAGTAALMALLPQQARPWLPAAQIGLVLLLALPLAQPSPWPDDFGEASTWHTVHIELAGRWLGTTSTADFVPVTVDMMPRPEESVLHDLFNRRVPERVNRVTLPAGTAVTFESVTPLHSRYHVSGSDDFLLRLFLFDFPGWTVRLNGQPAAKELGRPEGFLVVPVLAGEHVVDVRFGSTPARRLATAVSALSLLLALVGAWHFRRRPALSREFNAGDATRKQGPGLETLGIRANPLIPQSRPSSQQVADRPILAVVLLITALFVFLVEPAGWLRYHSTGYTALPAAQATFADFQEQIALIGYDLSGQVRPGEEIRLTLYWKAQRPLTINYQVFVHLLGPDGMPVSQSDKLNPGEFPTRRWPPDKYVRDEHRLVVPDALPPGTYRLTTGLWVVDDGWRLPLLDSEGRQIGDTFTLREWRLAVAASGDLRSRRVGEYARD